MPKGKDRPSASPRLRVKTSRATSCPAVLFLLLFLFPGVLRAEGDRGRFFLMGDGKLHIKNEHSGREAKASLLKADGSFDEEGLARIDEIFGFTSKTKGEHISPRLLFMLDYFSDRVAPGKVIHMESGYRSPEYNNNLRSSGGNVARTSVHMDGMAIDFYLDGVKGKDLWEIVKSKDCCGIGHYGGKTVHLDSTRPRFWEAATSKVKTGESDYNRRIYLTTEYDRYRAGETVQLHLVSVSDFGFGVKRRVAFVGENGESGATAAAELASPAGDDCVLIKDREAARSLSFSVPAGLRAGRTRIRLDFCRTPYEQMPLSTQSNEIELIDRPS
jgi:uncharacterized protein YcbK (DUF882 family)